MTFSGGISDDFANLINGNLATPTTAVSTKDADVNVAISGTVTITTAAHKTQLNAVLLATTGNVSGSVTGDATHLAGLTDGNAGSNNFAITLNDTTAPTTALLANICDATTGSIKYASTNGGVGNDAPSGNNFSLVYSNLHEDYQQFVNPDRLTSNGTKINARTKLNPDFAVVITITNSGSTNPNGKSAIDTALGASLDNVTINYTA